MGANSELFQKAMQFVRPLKKNKKRSLDKVKKNRFKQTPQHEFDDAGFEQAIIDNVGVEKVSGQQPLFYEKSKLPYRTIRKLKRGDFEIEASLDLHGYTVDQARKIICDFLTRAIATNKRCVCVVHGKGGGGFSEEPKLKNKVNNWLRQYPEVLAFCSAPIRDGGTGAVYVLLKAGYPRN
jgi:DNA-nicking Smr family endonuclease